MSSNSLIATSQRTSQKLCYYRNRTNKLQIIRVVNSKQTILEKVVFPRERILFEAAPVEQLEIFTPKAKGIGIAQIVSCQKLLVEEVRQDRHLAPTMCL